jgi:hypothetical protein
MAPDALGDGFWEALLKNPPDDKIYRATYAGAGEYNYEMEIEAREDGLHIDDYVVIVPWDWIEARMKERKP